MTASNRVKLKPGDTIGILGGGQLGRMLAMAAARLGLKCQVFSPEPDSPAFDVVLNAACAEYADVERLEMFAADVDVVTYEFENVPAATAMVLAAHKPGAAGLQDPGDHAGPPDREGFCGTLGIGTADYADVSSAEALRAAIARIGLPAVIKTRRFGYDGKGQAMIRDGDDVGPVWNELGTKSAILEAFVPFEREISVVAARSADGEVECYDVTENEHRDHILKISRAPAAHSRCARGPGARALPKRSPPRSTMSACSRSRCSWCRTARARRCWSTRSRRGCIIPGTGRWTAPSISQFEQHIRAIAGWPLGKPVRHGQVTMTNLIGDDINDYARWLTVPGATVHLYGKGPARPGRKMGHVTQVDPDGRKTA